MDQTEEKETLKMSRMNMSYCRMQNTLHALRECAADWYGDWNEEKDAFDMSKDELEARKELLALCQHLVDEHTEDDPDF